MSSVILAEQVFKTFQQRERAKGGFGGLRSFFSPKTTPVEAVSDISFAIGKGEAVGYLGPNGAGKSTMIKMLTGILVPTSGRVEVLGKVPHADRVANARQIGVVFGQRSQLWWDLPLSDSFELHRRIYRVEPARFATNKAEMVEMLDLGSFIERPVRQLSLGQRMRAEIAMALMHDPAVLFLDEPTIGLDVVAKDAVRKFLARINAERDVSIILTTHDLQDIEQICPRLIMVDNGRLLFDGPLAQLHTAFGARRKLTLEFSADPGAVSLNGAEALTGDALRREFLLPDDGRSLVDLIAELGNPPGLKDIHLHRPDIEEVIRTYYQSRGA